MNVNAMLDTLRLMIEPLSLLGDADPGREFANFEEAVDYCSNYWRTCRNFQLATLLEMHKRDLCAGRSEKADEAHT